MLPEEEHGACARHIYANWSKKHGSGELQMQLWKIEAKHRAYARHIHANGSKKHGSGELQMELWKIKWSTFEEEFIDNMK